MKEVKIVTLILPARTQSTVLVFGCKLLFFSSCCWWSYVHCCLGVIRYAICSQCKTFHIKYILSSLTKKPIKKDCAENCSDICFPSSDFFLFHSSGQYRNVSNNICHFFLRWGSNAIFYCNVKVISMSGWCNSRRIYIYLTVLILYYIKKQLCIL